jgi:hypothetical protein
MRGRLDSNTFVTDYNNIVSMFEKTLEKEEG